MIELKGCAGNYLPDIHPDNALDPDAGWYASGTRQYLTYYRKTTRMSIKTVRAELMQGGTPMHWLAPV